MLIHFLRELDIIRLLVMLIAGNRPEEGPVRNNAAPAAWHLIDVQRRLMLRAGHEPQAALHDIVRSE
ncbi:hypothetical protein D3C78_1961330 [compost metagenome]